MTEFRKICISETIYDFRIITLINNTLWIPCCFSVLNESEVTKAQNNINITHSRGGPFLNLKTLLDIYLESALQRTISYSETFCTV